MTLISSDSNTADGGACGLSTSDGSANGAVDAVPGQRHCLPVVAGPDGAVGSVPDKTTDADSAEPGWVLEWVDPAVLVVGANTRRSSALNRAFVGSVRDRGVREPITVRRGEDGRLVVRKGQRRALAAVQAGLERVPVVIQPEPVADQAEREIDRIVDQLGENRHREGLPEADEVAAHQQLLELGLTAGQIARRTRTSPKRVRAAVAVAGSDLAAAAMARYALSLEQAAVLAEFDDPGVVSALVAAARSGQFEHAAQRARDARAEKLLRQRLCAELAGAGVRVVERPDPSARRSTAAVRPLAELRESADAEPGVELTAAEHAGCPGHVAWLEHSWRAEEPVRVAYGCQGWRERGHAELRAQTGLVLAGPAVGEPGGAWSEEQKAERREVIASNKAWVSATTVRRAWLRRFLARRSAPKDAPQWIAVTLAAGSHDVRRAMEDGHRLAAQLLGFEAEDAAYRFGQQAHPLAVAALAASPGRATVLTLGLLLAALEAGTSKDTWRNPTAASAGYLNTLHRWGYELSDVERRAAGGASGPQADQDGSDLSEDIPGGGDDPHAHGSDGEASGHRSNDGTGQHPALQAGDPLPAATPAAGDKQTSAA